MFAKGGSEVRFVWALSTVARFAIGFGVSDLRMNGDIASECCRI